MEANKAKPKRKQRKMSNVPFWATSGFKSDPYPYSAIMAELCCASASLKRGDRQMCEQFLDKAIDHLQRGMDDKNELSGAICDIYTDMNDMQIDKAYYIALQLRDEKCGEVRKQQRPPWSKMKHKPSKEFIDGIQRARGRAYQAEKRKSARGSM